MAKFFKTIFLVNWLLASGFIVAAANIKPYKVIVPSDDYARKVAISFHHAVLEVNYPESYLILDLSDSEVEKLKQFDFKISPALKWQKKYEEFEKKRLSSVGKFEQKDGIDGYQCYATVEETLDEGLRLSQDYSTLSEWIDIGDSWSKANGQTGFDLMVLKITNEEITTEKPILFIHSSMHAREYTPAALTLDFARLLLEGYGFDPEMTRLIDEREIHILFHMNPDGRKIAETGVYQRKNVNQNYCANSTVGVDLNRNFAYFWNSTANGSSGNRCDETYRGPSAESEPETQAVSNYIRQLFPDARGPLDSDATPRNTPGIHLDIHSYSELVLWPWGHTEEPSPNDADYIVLGNKLAWFNNYTPQQSVGLYPTDGTSDDVSYGELGIAAFTFELGTDFFQDCFTYENAIRPRNLKALTYAAKVAAAPFILPSGPDVTKIEINGSEGEVTVASGASFELSVTATSKQTKLNGSFESIVRMEAVVNDSFDNSQAAVLTLTDSDQMSSDNEIHQLSISTAGLANGRHTLQLRSVDEAGNTGPVTAAFFRVDQNESPTASYSQNCNELTCQFDATASVDSDGEVSSYSWAFGDGTQYASSVISHTFSAAGTYSVVLIVTDNSGNTATVAGEVTVQAPVVTPPAENSSSGGGSLGAVLSLFALLFIRRRTRS